MKFNSLNGRDDVEYGGVGLVEISKIFPTKDTFFDCKAPFDRAHCIPVSQSPDRLGQSKAILGHQSSQRLSSMSMFFGQHSDNLGYSVQVVHQISSKLLKNHPM